MHILFVSPSKDSVLYSKTLQGLSDTTVHDVSVEKGFLAVNKKLDVVFFNAELGQSVIIEQVQGYIESYKPTKWIVTHLNDIHQSLYYMQAGASGVIEGGGTREAIQACLQSLSNGQIYLEDSLIQILAFRQIKKILLPFNLLTAREFDVFCLLAENYSIQSIAHTLSISSKTAFNCQTQIRKKLDLKNQQQVLTLAKTNGLIS